MTRSTTPQWQTFAEPHGTLREQIAIHAARLIAEEGLDYSSAKRKAVQALVGNRRTDHGMLPGNDEIEDELRAYQALFQSDAQPGRLRLLREIAVELMDMLAPFSPYLTGAVLNGTAGRHSDIHLELFCESAKDVQIFLLNQAVDFEVNLRAPTAPRGRKVDTEVISFMWRAHRADQPEGVHLTVYAVDGLRGALQGERGLDRANIAAVRKMIEDSHETDR